jgi:hypothetical protein
MTRDEMTRDEMTRDEMTRDEMTSDEMTKDEMTRGEMTRDEMTRDNMTSFWLRGPDGPVAENRCFQWIASARLIFTRFWYYGLVHLMMVVLRMYTYVVVLCILGVIFLCVKVFSLYIFVYSFVYLHMR